jgi:GDP-L-fucose synthase
LIRKFREAQERGQPEVVLWGDGSPTREFLHVRDAVEGIVLAAERYDGPEPVNIGAGFEIAIRELAEKISTLTGFRGAIRWDASRPNGQMRRRLDTSRALSLFGFEARIGFDEGLRETIAWWDSVRAKGA